MVITNNMVRASSTILQRQTNSNTNDLGKIRGEFLASLIAGYDISPEIGFNEEYFSDRFFNPSRKHEITNFKVIGPLDLCRKKLNQKLELISLQFIDRVRLNNSQFKAINIEHCSFWDELSLYGSVVLGDAHIKSCKLRSSLEASKAVFHGDVTIDDLPREDGDECWIRAQNLSAKGRVVIRKLNGIDGIDLSECRADRSVVIDGAPRREMKIAESDRPQLANGIILQGSDIGGDLKVLNLTIGKRYEVSKQEGIGQPHSSRLSLVNLDGIRVVGDLKFQRVRIYGPISGYAISATGSVFKQSVLFQSWSDDNDINRQYMDQELVVVESGGVRFSECSIIRDFDLRALTSHGADEKGIALWVRSATIGGALRLDDEKPASSNHVLNCAFAATNGSVLIHSVEVGSHLELERSYIGGFNHKYENTLSIYGCIIHGKLEINKFRTRLRSTGICTRCGITRRQDSKTIDEKYDDLDALCRPPNDSLDLCHPNERRVSPKIQISNTNARVLQIGKPIEDVDGDYWNLFNLAMTRLTFSGFEYGELENSTFYSKDWIKLLTRNGENNERRFDPAPWSHAARVLEAEGYPREARELRYHRERGLFKSHGKTENIFFRFLYNDFGAFTGYGFRISYLAWWFLIAWLSVACVSWSAYQSNWMVPAEAEVLVAGETPGDYPKFIAPLYALDVLAPILELDQTKYWRPGNISKKGPLEAPGYWAFEVLIPVFRAFGVVFLTFLFAALSPLVNRK